MKAWFFGIFILLPGVVIAEQKKYEFSDLNVEVIVGVEGKTIPFQIMSKGDDANGKLQWLYRPYDKPMPVKIGDKFKLKVEILDRQGRRRDITGSKYLHYSTSRGEVFFVDKDGWLLIAPKVNSDDPVTARSGVGSVEVEYISETGEIGFGGFSVDVRP